MTLNIKNFFKKRLKLMIDLLSMLQDYSIEILFQLMKESICKTRLTTIN